VIYRNEKVNNTCGKEPERGTMARGFTIFGFSAGMQNN
jgi:hypothetical protein